MPDWYYLREEARKSWNYLITDSLVYRFKVMETGPHSILTVSKNNFSAKWLELNLRLVGQSKKYLRMIIEILVPDGTRGPLAKIVGGDGCVHRDMTMFVNIPKCVENPEVVDLSVVPVLVWLHSSDNGNGLFGNAESAFNECDFDIDGSDFVDWKTKSLGNGVAGVGMSDGIHLPNQMVKRGAEARNKISGNQCHPEVEVGRTNLNDILSSFKIILGEDRLHVRFLPSLYRLAQGIEVFFRPVDFAHYCANW